MSDTSVQTELTDEQLAERISVRSESREHWRNAARDFESLYARHSAKMLAFLSSRVKRSDVEDVHQAIWQRVWQHLPDRFRGGNFRAWLHQIARNYLIDRSRKKQTDLIDDDRQFSDPQSVPPDDQLIERERMQILRQCLERLDREMSQLVQARLIGDSYPEICSRLEIRVERAHKLFHQAKAQLTTCVERASQ